MDKHRSNEKQINAGERTIVSPPPLGTRSPVINKPSTVQLQQSQVKAIADSVSKELNDCDHFETVSLKKQSEAFKPSLPRQNEGESSSNQAIQLCMQAMMQQFSTVCQQLVTALDKKPSPSPAVSSASSSATNTNVYNIQPALAPVTFTKRKRSEMTPDEIQEEERVAKKLKETIPQKEIQTRPGPGGTSLQYASAFTVIDHANQVFGYDGWSYRILNYVLDKPSQNSKTSSITVFARVMVEVTLASSGAISQEMGCGKGIDKDLFEAQSTAIKSGTSDALKRCLRRFGNFTGNCLYDKDFLEHKNEDEKHDE